MGDKVNQARAEESCLACLACVCISVCIDLKSKHRKQTGGVITNSGTALSTFCDVALLLYPV